MFEFMHKNRKVVMVFTIVFIGVPLAFFVPGLGGGGGRQADIARGQLPVVTVGDTVVTSAELLNVYGQYTDMRAAQGLSTDPLDMRDDGTLDEIVEQLIQSAIVREGAAENPVAADRDYLSERLKEFPMFQDQQTGEFQPALYNQWVEGNIRAGTSWDQVFQEVADIVTRETYNELLQASGHVSEAEVREIFERSKQKVKVKYVQVSPDTTQTEEQLRAFFDERNEDELTKYMTFPGRTIEYVAFSVVPPMPAEVNEAVERARGGEDFAALVEEYSVGADKYEGGDMGWIEVTEDPTPQQEAIFALEPGEVSDPVESFTEIHVYRLEEERIREEDDTMEVRARRIVFRPALSAEDRMAAENAANALLEKVKADADLQAAAADAGLTVQTSVPFDAGTTEIEGIPQNDVFAIRRGTLDLGLDEVAPTILSGTKNLYVAKVASIIEPREKSFEEAREDVERDAVAEYKRSEAYLEQREGFIEKIKSDASTLADVATVVPELADAAIEESREFGAGDQLFQDGLFWMAQEAFAMVIDTEPGTISGPLRDFRDEMYILELVEVVEPEPEALETEWQEAKGEMLVTARNRAGIERQLDYLQYASDRAQHVEGIVMRHNDAINEVLGIDDSGFVVPTETEITEELNSDIADVEGASEAAPEE